MHLLFTVSLNIIEEMWTICTLNEDIHEIPYMDVSKYLVCLWNYVNYNILIISIAKE